MFQNSSLQLCSSHLPLTQCLGPEQMIFPLAFSPFCVFLSYFWFLMTPPTPPLLHSCSKTLGFALLMCTTIHVPEETDPINYSPWTLIHILHPTPGTVLFRLPAYSQLFVFKMRFLYTSQGGFEPKILLPQLPGC